MDKQPDYPRKVEWSHGKDETFERSVFDAAVVTKISHP